MIPALVKTNTTYPKALRHLVERSKMYDQEYLAHKKASQTQVLIETIVSTAIIGGLLIAVAVFTQLAVWGKL